MLNVLNKDRILLLKYYDHFFIKLENVKLSQRHLYLATEKITIHIP